MTTKAGSVVNAVAMTLKNQLIDESNVWLQRKAISQTITLLESQLEEDEALAHEVLTLLHQQQERPPRPVLRVGIAGSPGAGKSSFLEAFGQYMLQQQQQTSNNNNNNNNNNTTTRFAILCVDPSSAHTTGSILADKTRMPVLASNADRCFVRPCPSRSVLGGLAPHTESVCRLVSFCFSTVFIETVGLGQSETDIQHVTDCVLYLVSPHSGDDLQAAKQGILEVVDAVVVTKADGDSLSAARRTAGDFRGCGSSTRRDELPVFLTSSVTGDGLEQVWDFLEQQRRNNNTSPDDARRRREQDRYWTRKHLCAAAIERLEKRYNKSNNNNNLSGEIDHCCEDVPPRVAARLLLNKIWPEQ